MSDHESITDEFRAKPCVPDSGPFNAGVESYECLIHHVSVLEMNVPPNLAFNTVVLVTLVYNHLSEYVFVHRAFCAYFLRIERVVEVRRFLWWTQ